MYWISAIHARNCCFSFLIATLEGLNLLFRTILSALSGVDIALSIAETIGVLLVLLIVFKGLFALYTAIFGVRVFDVTRRKAEVLLAALDPNINLKIMFVGIILFYFDGLC